MPGTELDDLQALLDKVRPDPTGFAQRLLVQVMTRFGDVPEPDPAVFYTADEEPAITVPAEPVTYADPEPDLEVDTCLLLAAALGACRCAVPTCTSPICSTSGPAPGSCSTGRACGRCTCPTENRTGSTSASRCRSSPTRMSTRSGHRGCRPVHGRRWVTGRMSRAVLR
jgi:hypothetical protein